MGRTVASEKLRNKFITDLEEHKYDVCRFNELSKVLDIPQTYNTLEVYDIRKGDSTYIASLKVSKKVGYWGLEKGVYELFKELRKAALFIFLESSRTSYRGYLLSFDEFDELKSFLRPPDTKGAFNIHKKELETCFPRNQFYDSDDFSRILLKESEAQ